MLESQEGKGSPSKNAPVAKAQQSEFELQLLQQAIDRTEAIVREESSVLKRGIIRDLHDFSSRKSHQLLALNRAFRSVDAADHRELLTKELDSLRNALEENAKLLQIRLVGLEEVADIIAGIMRDAESDGTYSRLVAAGVR